MFRLGGRGRMLIAPGRVRFLWPPLFARPLDLVPEEVAIAIMDPAHLVRVSPDLDGRCEPLRLGDLAMRRTLGGPNLVLMFDRARCMPPERRLAPLMQPFRYLERNAPLDGFSFWAREPRDLVDALVGVGVVRTAHPIIWGWKRRGQLPADWTSP